MSDVIPPPLTAWVGFAGLPPRAFHAPRRTLEAYALHEVTGVLAAAEREALDGAHVVGMLSYEAAPALEPSARVPCTPVLPGFPLAWFAVYDAPAEEGDASTPSVAAAGAARGGCVGGSSPASAASASASAAAAADAEVPLPPLPAPCGVCAAARGAAAAVSPLPAAPWRESCTREAYDAALARVHTAIRDGVAYQVNHTLRLEAAWPPSSGGSSGIEGGDGPAGAGGSGIAGGGSGASPAAPLRCPACTRVDDLHFLRALLRAQRGAYGAFLDMGRFRVLSASPELFFEWDRARSGALLARPMKGTRPRGLWPRADGSLRADLAASAKDAAENLMIVDLLRNDMSRVASRGSVAVGSLFAVGAFPTVWQMTTDVSCAVRPGTGLLDVLRALFPCGSVTGAPKLSAMALIAELEAQQGRGAYCGALLALTPGGSVTASVPIRTLVLDCAAGRAVYGLGGGITWDSAAEDEWDEALAKAAVLRLATDAVRDASCVDGEPVPGAPAWPLTSPLVHRPPWFSLFETLRLRGAGGGDAAGGGGTAVWSDAAGYVLEAEHLARLGASAAYLLFPWDACAAAAALAGAAEHARRNVCADGTDARVRLLLAPDGAFSTEVARCMHSFAGAPSGGARGGGSGGCGGAGDSNPPTTLPALVLLARDAPVQRRHPLLYHKTTDRRCYTEPAAAARAAWRAAGGDPEGVLDVLLCNEEGEVTEFTIGCVVAEVRRSGGEGDARELVTPPIACGLLPGVFREHLLRSGAVVERVLTLDDVAKAERLWLINSVRGWVSVKLCN